MADFVPVHPGEILLTEFMQPMALSQNGLARSIHVSPRRINEIVHGRRAITAETALKLSQALGLSETFWVNMQAHYDAELAKDKLGDSLRRIPRIVGVPVPRKIPAKRVAVVRRALPPAAADKTTTRSVAAAAKKTGGSQTSKALRSSTRRGRSR
jgi:addiction module HigA family antidote